MKSKIHKGMTVRSELRPATGLLDKSFVYIRPEKTDLAATFKRIRDEQAAKFSPAIDATVVPMARRKRT